ncbi:GNAT family N-acetyltransferase [Nocardiopsis sp. NRRL B-16309]|uniref:GNAT family N-acetyltransferase n=1 Tax=Nocardiopsis sp. NRRL B-16309 TaxID=1519494 RepID=UPI0006B00E78|nr:GNAT family N-acetyltransferase [Nocardiopsis sp. NRRL B-16309]KOX15487.1 acetyltransferase [Nocardiopsis sp. NRRL B-16309]
MTNSSVTGPSGRRPDDWTVRGIGGDEFPEVARVVGEALLSPVDVESRVERLRPIIGESGLDRILVAVDGDEVVGAVNSFDFEMAMPGGPRQVAGVTGVGVWPTYRRRGVLSALMRRQLADLRGAGESVAALWASEGGIYGRFGYGAASMEAELSIASPHAALRADAPRDPELTVRLTDPGRVRDELEALFRQEAATRIGRFQRSEAWWDRVLRDERDERGDHGPLRAALVDGPGGPQGYALYRVRADWGHTGPRSELRVQEMVSTTPAARVALYEHVLSRDLVAKVVFGSAAVDDPLWALAADRQRIGAVPGTALWIRLVDVRAALSERGYAAPVETVVELTDRHAPWNAGRWRLKADRDAARAEATESGPDLSMDVSHLGAAYLGQNTLAAQLAAGVITEHTPGAAERFDAALRVPHAPLCAVIF